MAVSSFVGTSTLTSLFTPCKNESRSLCENLMARAVVTDEVLRFLIFSFLFSSGKPAKYPDAIGES